MLIHFLICLQISRNFQEGAIIGCRVRGGTKAVSPARWSGGERGREKRSGARKVDLPVAQLLAAHSLYLLRLESPVSQGRIVEEAKYVTGDRQVSDRAREDFNLTEKKHTSVPFSLTHFFFLFYRKPFCKIRF